MGARSSSEKRKMQNVFMSAGTESGAGFDARKFPVMKRLAKLHGCTAEVLCSGIDASEPDVNEVLGEMLSNAEVEASSSAGARETYTLTRKGWREYMDVLGSIYELPE